MTSMRAKVDRSLKSCEGPYYYRIQGQNCHNIGSLLPLSPLHTELGVLTWAIEMVLQKGFTYVLFQLDYSELLKVIEDADEWPALATKLEFFHSLRIQFIHFKLLVIPRLSNVRADHLAKGARACGIEFSHISYRFPDWLPLETSMFDKV
ncbi:hypothetical protein V5N11_022604 [Cardamine amara subsp. amara]|uniref:RNase H type-1 domain-containing protein n=1 Tax=Cardamine amara subsp. amara TaxID=228776 RepID=A0ABD1AVQ9_CARAN